MISEALQKAIDNLQIQDVHLRWSQAQCIDGFRPQDTNFTTLQVQHMQTPKKSELYETGAGDKLLDVHVVAGLRWVFPTTEKDKEPEIMAFIEAEFIAEYRLLNDIDQASIDEFSLKNAIHHVWPYWREYLASQEERLRLPRTPLPMLQLVHHKRSAGDQPPSMS